MAVVRIKPCLAARDAVGQIMPHGRGDNYILLTVPKEDRSPNFTERKFPGPRIQKTINCGATNTAAECLAGTRGERFTKFRRGEGFAIGRRKTPFDLFGKRL